MKKKSIQNRYRSKLILEELEARQLFSGGAEAVIPPPESTPSATVIEVDANAEPVAENQAQAPHSDSNIAQNPSGTSTNVQAATLAPTYSAETLQRHEIAFVDTNVDGFQQLVDDLAQQNSANKQIEVVLLTADRDGLEQISETLQDRQGIDAIHIFSYGRDGAVELGGVWHNSLSIEAQASQISHWGTAFTTDSDILLYGCNVAGNADGELFVNRLSELTGADVNASADITGNANLGGDWELEYRDGNIETSVALSQTTQQDWSGVLDITTGLLGHWKFDANANDSSGNNYNGTLINGVLIDTTAGTNKEGTGKLSLDGINDYVDLSAYRTNFTSLTQGTIAAWIKTSTVSGQIFVLSDIADVDSTIGLRVASSGVLVYDVWENSGNLLNARSTTTVNDGNWHHVAATIDSTGNKLYIDGVQSAVTYTAGNATSNTFFSVVSGIDTMSIGHDQNSSGGRFHFNGLIDDVRIYNRALTLSDIALLANDAPTLNNARTPTLSSINEDAGMPVGAVGTLVSQLVDFASPSGQVDNVTDIDSGALLGIAVTATDTTNGTWWYSTNNGSNWNALGAVSNANARLLAADVNTRLYFQPNANYNGTLTNAITFRAWDQSAGTNGSTADTSVNGGITAFSSATDTASLVVNAVNDAPTLSVTGSGTVSSGGTYTVNLSASDPEGVTITSWKINWGDGTISTYVGNPASVNHVYNAALGGFTFNITASATDADGTHYAEKILVPSWSGTDLVHIYGGSTGVFLGTMAPITDGLNDQIEVIQGSNGHVYVSSEAGSNIVEYTQNGTFVRTFVTSGSGGLSGAAGMAFGPDGNLYVASFHTGAVLRYNGTTGAFMGVFVATGTGGLNAPLGLNFGLDGMLYVASRGANNILRFDARTGAHDASFNGNLMGGVPEDFTFGPDGRIYVSDLNGGRIVRINSTTGAFVDTFVANGVGGLTSPAGLGFGPDGNLYVADQNNNAIRKYNGATGAFISNYVASGYGGLVNPAYFTFLSTHQVAVVNAAPVNTIPNNRYTPLNTAVTFSGAGGNVIQISDIDAGSNPVQLTLSVNNGTLNLTSTVGLTLISGVNGSATLTYSGTVSALNTALNNGVTFNPTTNYRGLAQLTVTTNDQGNTGGGALSDTDTVNVHVGALVVTNLNDSSNGNTSSIANLVASDGGDGISFREAILAANATPNGSGPDYIYFNIAGAGPHVINLSADLPAINSPVIIDASSEPDYSGTPVVVLNGSGTIQDGIQLYGGSGGSTIRGLVIQNFIGDGIDISSSNGNSIVGNWIGLDATGTAAAGNVIGVNIWNSNNNVIGGSTPADRNVISGNTNLGITINTDNGTSIGNQIRGNYIGTDYTGIAAVGNKNNGIYINSTNNTIGGTAANQGNVISATQNWAGIGLGTAANNTSIAGNFIGLNATGTAALSNVGGGITVESANNTIGGITPLTRNIISGNSSAGIRLIGATATANVVIGNYIGTDITGTQDINGTAQISGRSGVVMQGGASNNRIGTNADGSNDVDERNIISGNNWYGVEMIDAGTSNNVVQGNYIGTDVTGLLALGNSQGGVSFWNGAVNNRVGSGLTGAGNVISGNETGVQIANGVTNNKVQGNIIGLGADGSTVVGNTGIGVLLHNGGTALSVTGNIIGTDSDGNNDAGEPNVISANYGGVALDSAEVTGNRISGNYIGTDSTGLLARGNTSYGVYIFNGAHGNTIGGTSANTGNRIMFNTQHGVGITESASVNNAILGNRISENGGLGIDLDWDGLSLNDLPANLDADPGANNLQNFPVLYTATTTGNTLAIRGAIDSTANTTFRIEFFNNPLGTEDPTGHGEGRIFLYAVDVTTNASGHADFDLAPMSAIVAANDSISATATVNLGGGNYGSTSEFSMNLPATTAGPSNTAPSTTQIVNEDTALVFSSANGNAITVSDNALSDNRLEVTLISTNGLLTLATTSGITFLAGANNSASMVLVGTESAINNTLNGLSFLPSANYYGAANVQVTSKLAADLEGYYSFNGNTNDQSTGVVQNGTLVGNATIITDGSHGQVLSLDGTGDAVQINGVFNSPTNITIGGWVNLISASGRTEFISLNDRVHIALDDAGGVKGSIQTSAGSWDDLDSGRFIAGTGWHHVMYSFDDTNNVHSLYIDGVLAASETIAGSIYWPGATTTYVGQHPTSGNYLNGQVDDIRIYNRALGASEIAALSGDLSQSTSNIGITVNSVNDAPTFNAGSGSVSSTVGSGDDWARAMTLQSDGKMVVVGYSSNGSNDDFAIVRYNTNGSLDTTFGTGGKVTVGVGSSVDEAYAVTIQSDGKIIVAGRSHNGSNLDFAVIRLNTDGSLDTSFSGDGKVMVDFAGTTEDTQSVIVQSDGKIIVGGTSNSLFAMTRLNSDGSLDTAFGVGGKVTTDATATSDSGYSLALQTDGKILMAGAGNNNFALVRYNSNGSLDTGFGTSGKVETDLAGGTDYGRSVIANSDGTILVSGYSSFGDFALVKYTSTGVLDTTFGSGTGKVLTNINGSDVAVDMVVQPDNKIILGGYDGSFNSTLVRYNANGTLDTSFGNSGKVTTTIASGSFIEGLAVRPDGRIVTGIVATVSGNKDFGIISYLPDGSIDSTFNTTSVTNTLDGNPSYTENGSAVVLDSNVQIFDAELSLSNFNGATLTLVRNGGNNFYDVFSATGTLVTLAQGSNNLKVDGKDIGSVSLNSGGRLELTFNADATNALVNSAMRQIAYSNTSDAPPASVQINWVFNDSNTSLQGTGGQLSANGSVIVSISAVNDSPETANASVSGTEDSASIPVTLAATDVDGSVSAFRLISLPSNGTLYLDAGLTTTAAALTNYAASASAITLYFKPDLNWNGSTSFGYTSFDNEGGEDLSTALINIAVANSNDAPTVANPIPDQAATEDSAFSYQVAADAFADPDLGDSLTYSATGLPAWLSFNAASRTFSGTPGNADVGAATVTVRATDTGGGYAEASFGLAVANSNDAPTVAPTTLAAIGENSGTRLITQAELLSNATDADNDTLLATELTLNTGNGTLTNNTDGTWTYTAALNDDSSVSFNYQITDGTASIAAIASLDITPANDATTSIPDVPVVRNSTIFVQDIKNLNDTNRITYINPTVIPNGSSPQTLIKDAGYSNGDTNLNNIKYKSIIDLNSRIDRSLSGLEQSTDVNFYRNKLITFSNDPVEGEKQTHSVKVLQAKKHKIFVNNYNIAAENAFEDRMEQMHKQFDNMDLVNPNKIDVQIMLGTTITLTAGFVSWILRGGALLKSLLLSVPLLNRYDPVPILRSSNKKDALLSDDPIENKVKDHLINKSEEKDAAEKNKSDEIN
jgi:uncharacterized delta-60 repeat protein